MNPAASAPWTPAGAGGRRWLFATLLVFGCAVTAAAAVVGNGSVAVALAPILTATLIGAVWLAPMRITLLALVFLGLGVDASNEGPWNSPVSWIGHLLSHNLNKTVPVEALAIPLVVIGLGCLLIMHVHRRFSGSRIDGVGRGTRY